MKTTVALLTALIVPGLVQASNTTNSPETILIRGPYVQLATPSSIYVVWRTDRKINPVVRYGPLYPRLDQQVNGPAVAVRYGTTNGNLALGSGIGRLHSAPEGTWQYEAHLTGLKPDTRYYYAVYDGEKRLTDADASYQFRTHPRVGASKPVRFWVVGDSGTGKQTQAEIHAAMQELTRRQNRFLDLYLHVGDMAYSQGKDVEFQTRFFEMYEPTLRNTVCWPAMGNHEGKTSKGAEGMGPYYDAYVLPTRAESGGVASGMEAFYSFDYGRVHFICLNSHDLDRKPTGAMARWLRADLDKAKADWLIAFWHHPPYSKGSHDSDKDKQLVEMRTHIMPILESSGVDLVLTGHSHIYERSMLMDGAYATPTVATGVILDDREGNPSQDGPYRKSAGLHPHEGAVQVVAGHGGAKLKRKGTMPVMRKIIVEHGSVIVDIDGDSLTAIMLNQYGEERDRFGLVKRGKVVPQRLSNPWQPPLWTPPKDSEGKELLPDPPEDFITVIPQGAQWRYLAGTHPGTNWMLPAYNVAQWKTGEAGFGYGDNDDRTVLRNMRDSYSTVYIRRDFEVEQADQVTEIGLMIRYDDAFIAYLNGHEVARIGVRIGQGRDARNIKSHNASEGYAYVPLKNFEKCLKPGQNVIAIEGHNKDLDSSDFTLDPYLIVED